MHAAAPRRACGAEQLICGHSATHVLHELPLVCDHMLHLIRCIPGRLRCVCLSSHFNQVHCTVSAFHRVACAQPCSVWKALQLKDMARAADKRLLKAFMLSQPRLGWQEIDFSRVTSTSSHYAT